MAIQLPTDADFDFRWELRAPAGYEFQLVFGKHDVDGVPLPGNRWPFRGQGSGPKRDTTPWQPVSYQNTVIRDGAYKYSVFVRDPTGVIVGSVDPMIIVGRV